MKKLLLSIAMIAAVAACDSGQQETPNVGEAPAVSGESAPMTAKPEPAREEKGIDVLIGLGFKPDFAYSVVYDIIDRNDAGVRRHRVLLEVLGGNIVTAMEDAGSTLAEAGYVKSKETESDGRRDVVFTRQGFPTLVFMAQTPERGPALKTPGAVGTIHIMWNIY